jgi:hypothetical protein
MCRTLAIYLCGAALVVVLYTGFILAEVGFLMWWDR